MPSPRRIRRFQNHMVMRAGVLFTMALAGFLATPPKSKAQIATTIDNSGRRMFVNEELNTATVKLAPIKPHTTIYMPSESSFLV